MSKKIFSFILGFVIIFSPALVVRAVDFSGLVPKCNTQSSQEKIEYDANGVKTSTSSGFTDPCDFEMLMAMINNLITFLLVTMATPIFALIIIYAAWLYLSDMGSSENVKKAKHILTNAVVGYIIALAAWLIVKTIVSMLGFTGDTFLS